MSPTIAGILKDWLPSLLPLLYLATIASFAARMMARYVIYPTRRSQDAKIWLFSARIGSHTWTLFGATMLVMLTLLLLDNPGLASNKAAELYLGAVFGGVMGLAWAGPAQSEKIYWSTLHGAWMDAYASHRFVDSEMEAAFGHRHYELANGNARERQMALKEILGA